jgi:hypothetical protein
MIRRRRACRPSSLVALALNLDHSRPIWRSHHLHDSASGAQLHLYRHERPPTNQVRHQYRRRLCATREAAHGCVPIGLRLCSTAYIRSTSSSSPTRASSTPREQPHPSNQMYPASVGVALSVLAGQCKTELLRSLRRTSTRHWTTRTQFNLRQLARTTMYKLIILSE